jgi:hypothetical protein
MASHVVPHTLPQSNHWHVGARLVRSRTNYSEEQSDLHGTTVSALTLHQRCIHTHYCGSDRVRSMHGYEITRFDVPEQSLVHLHSTAFKPRILVAMAPLKMRGVAQSDTSSMHPAHTPAQPFLNL